MTDPAKGGATKPEQPRPPAASRGSGARELPAWASGRSVRFALAVLQAQGHRVAGLMKRAGLEAGVAADPDARLPHPVVRAVWEAAIDETGDDALGLHVAERVRPVAFDALGYVFRCSPTLGQGLERLIRYHRFVDDLLTLAIEPCGAQVRILVAGIDAHDVTRPMAEFLLATLIRTARVETGRHQLNPAAVEFAFARPARTAEHSRFFQAPVRFGQRRHCLVLEASALDLPLRLAEPELREVLERRVRDVIARLPPTDTVVARTRYQLGAQLASGTPTAAAVGRGLGLSPRSLRRRLRAEGLSFRDLLHALRRELAEQHLQQGRSIDETAFLLGYAESSALHRAFRRWTGRTPAAFRREQGRTPRGRRA